MNNNEAIARLQAAADIAIATGCELAKMPAMDALAIADLLKEQEKRINTLEEKLRLLEYGDMDTLQSAMMPAT